MRIHRPSSVYACICIRTCVVVFLTQHIVLYVARWPIGERGLLVTRRVRYTSELCKKGAIKCCCIVLHKHMHACAYVE